MFAYQPPVDDTHTVTVQKSPASVAGGRVVLGKGASINLGPNMSLPVKDTNTVNLRPEKGSVSQADWNATNNAVGAMQRSGRSEEFMKAHLGDVKAMQSKNWGLTDSQASQARLMENSGRSKAFIRGKLGLSQDTYVPGKQG